MGRRRHIGLSTGAVAALVLAACAGADSAPTPPPENDPTFDDFLRPPTRCPEMFSDVDLALCARRTPERYGYSEDQPLEYGWDASSGKPWFGRLHCPNGALPEVERVENLGRRQYGSVAPCVARSKVRGSAVASRAADGTCLDMIDAWKVVCPGGQGVSGLLYVNAYRCGIPCPPPGLRLLPARSAKAYYDSRKAYEGGRIKASWRLALEALSAMPDSERLLKWQGVVAVRLRDYQAARTAYDGALRANPGDPYHLLHRAVADKELGRFAAHDAALAELYERLGESSHPLAAELTCRMAAMFLRHGEDGRANGLALMACSMGFEQCCLAR